MIFTGPNSGAAWGLAQVVDAYRGIAELVKPLYGRCARGTSLPLSVLNGTAAHMPSIADQSVDLVCMDPPYYDNVQYGELSDYFYVWQRRTLSDLYPAVFTRRLVNKNMSSGQPGPRWFGAGGKNPVRTDDAGDLQQMPTGLER